MVDLFVKLPVDWSWEGPDESVGIFGSGYYHDCPDNDDSLAERREVTFWFTGEGANRVRNTKIMLRCPSCWTLIETTEVDYDPYFQEDL